jgi:hypothetical protein
LGDLLRFVQANLMPQQSPLRAALLLSRQPQGDSEQSVGLGWNTVQVADGDQTWPLVWRASRTAGFSVFLGFRTDRQQALVLLGNTDADLSALGIAWLEGRSPPPLQPPPPAMPAAAELAAYPGLYRIAAGNDFVVRVGTDGLTAQFPGQFPLDLRAVGDDVFAATGDAFVLSFQREGHAVTSILLGHDGTNVIAQRLSERPPVLERTALAIDAGKLHEYVGDYRLAADTLLRIAAHEGKLTAQASGLAPRALIAFAPDRFADPRGACEIHFLRNDKHAVTSLKIVLAGAERSAGRVDWRTPSLR